MVIGLFNLKIGGDNVQQWSPWPRTDCGLDEFFRPQSATTVGPQLIMVNHG